MSYSTFFLGKDLTALNYDDIVNFFIEEKEESDKIEFKSNAPNNEKDDKARIEGVIKTICAFLNSEGGLIIWGAPIGQKVDKKKEKIFKGELTPSDKLIEKDSFINRIANAISPSPNGIRLQKLEKDNKYIYIIDIEQSQYAPHQFQSIYYMRLDGQSRPAPHHYIEALFRKVTYPRLRGHIIINSCQLFAGNQYVIDVSCYIFNMSKLQNEHNIYLQLCTDIGSINYKNISNNGEKYFLEGNELRISEAMPILFYNNPLVEKVSISYMPYKLINYESDLLLYFGGKQSPLMVSKYKLSFKDPYVRDPNSLITHKEENIYIYDVSDNLDASEDEKIKKAMGR